MKSAQAFCFNTVAGKSLGGMYHRTVALEIYGTVKQNVLTDFFTTSAEDALLFTFVKIQFVVA